MSDDENTALVAKIKAYRAEDKGTLIGKLIASEERCKRIRDEAIDECAVKAEMMANYEFPRKEFALNIRRLKGE